MKRRGFTLIELLVVIVIIGILATVSTATFSGAIGKARDAERITTVKQVGDIMKGEGLSIPGEHRYFWGGAGFRALLEKNGYTMPAAKKDICYFIVASSNDGDPNTNGPILTGGGWTSGGDNNEFVVLTWGESSSTTNPGSPGVIVTGTPNYVEIVKANSTGLSQNDFRCPLRGEFSEINSITQNIRDTLLPNTFDRLFTIIVGEAAKPEDLQEIGTDTELNKLLTLS